MRTRGIYKAFSDNMWSSLEVNVYVGFNYTSFICTILLLQFDWKKKLWYWYGYIGTTLKVHLNDRILETNLKCSNT